MGSTFQIFLKQGRLGDGLDSFDNGVKEQMLAGALPQPRSRYLTRGDWYSREDTATLPRKKSLCPPTSIFRVASVSKAITGTAIVKLIEQGKLDYTDNIAIYSHIGYSLCVYN
jgi:CubicO group peptidase (beta-lactamase class C family)